MLVSDLFGNHIVGFPSRRLNSSVCFLPGLMGSLVAHMSGAMLKHRGQGDDPENPLTPHSEDSDQPVNKSKIQFCRCLKY